MKIQAPAPREAACSDCGRSSADGVHLVLTALLAPERRVWLCAASQPCISLTVERYRIGGQR